MNELVAAGESASEFLCSTSKGTVVTVARRCFLRCDAAGTPSAVILVLTDVTESRLERKELVLLNSDMEHRIHCRNAELEESNKDLREFAYSIARPACATRSHRWFQRAIVARLQEDYPERVVAAEIHDTPEAQGDPRLLTDVLENLLNNAFKFSARKAALHIVFDAYQLLDGTHVYRLIDNGTGFDPTYARKLFGLFQRLHTRAEFAGTGLGLAIVRKIVARHGGRVWAESSPGEGATFCFTLNERCAADVFPPATRCPPRDP